MILKKIGKPRPNKDECASANMFGTTTAHVDFENQEKICCNEFCICDDVNPE